MKNFINKINQLLKNETFQKYQVYILPSVSIIICLPITVLLIIPQFLKIQANKANLSEIKQKQQFFTDKAQILEQIDPNTYKDNLAATLVALPEDKDIPGMIGQVLLLLSQNGLKLDDISFAGEAGKTGNVSSYQIKLQLSGDANSIRLLVQKVKEAPRLLKLTALNIAGTDLKTGVLETGIELDSFFQPLPTQIGNIDQQVTLITDADKQNLAKLKEYLSQTSGGSGTEFFEGAGKSDPFQ